MVTSVTRGSQTSLFEYGPDRARYKRVDLAPAGTTTTLYVGGKAPFSHAAALR